MPVIDAVTWRRFLRYLPGFYRGTHPQLPEVEAVRTPSLSIDASSINAYAAASPSAGCRWTCASDRPRSRCSSPG